jgi:hypothetical protein
VYQVLVSQRSHDAVSRCECLARHAVNLSVVEDGQSAHDQDLFLCYVHSHLCLSTRPCNLK